MTALDLEADPVEMGLDTRRLLRVEDHLKGYVDKGLLPGWIVVVSRAGKVVYLARYGQRDMEAGLALETDTRFRIYSMTKPITSIAAMMLYEKGAFELTDPVSKFIPSFGDARVWHTGSSLVPVTQPLVEPVRIWHLLTHTSGLTYGFHYAHPVDELYRKAGFEWTHPRGMDLAACCDCWAGLPLLFQPGSEWNYSVATDVLGRVVEVVSKESLDSFLAEQIFNPLGMTDTGFWVSAEHKEKLAALYSPEPATGLAKRNDLLGALALEPPGYLSGGGGLISTAADYHRFMKMLLGEGQLGGTRLIGPRTLRYMVKNHLPGDRDLQEFGRPLYAETSFSGVGFGLGFSVLKDPVANKVLASPGEYGWGGAASTLFWVDPAEELTTLFLTQLLPSSTYPIRSQLRQLVYQALID
ncbi:MAG: beta-lactamase family protein [Actinobacteria bacterium]|nr:beta-lactamase family protein [Actinomycetota bacterium]